MGAQDKKKKDLWPDSFTSSKLNYYFFCMKAHFKFILFSLLLVHKYYNLIFKAYHQGIIDGNTWNYLNIKKPKTPTFYALPKVHKSLKHPPW